MIFDKRGYTLAEVLITMAIVGVIAAMTIPNLNTSTRNKEKTARFQSIMSRIEDAIQKSEKIYKCYYIPTENEISTNFYNLKDKNIDGGEINTDCDRFYEDLMENLGDARECTGSCLPSKYLREDENKNACFTNVNKVYMLKDGSYIFPSVNKITSFAIDINGKRPPNKYGEDVFILAVKLTNAGTVEDGTDENGDPKYRILPTRVEIFPSTVTSTSDKGCDFEITDKKSTNKFYNKLITQK